MGLGLGNTARTIPVMILLRAPASPGSAIGQGHLTVGAVGRLLTAVITGNATRPAPRGCGVGRLNLLGAHRPVTHRNRSDQQHHDPPQSDRRPKPHPLDDPHPTSHSHLNFTNESAIAYMNHLTRIAGSPPRGSVLAEPCLKGVKINKQPARFGETPRWGTFPIASGIAGIGRICAIPDPTETLRPGVTRTPKLCEPCGIPAIPPEPAPFTRKYRGRWAYSKPWVASSTSPLQHPRIRRRVTRCATSRRWPGRWRPSSRTGTSAPKPAAPTANRSAPSSRPWTAIRWLLCSPSGGMAARRRLGTPVGSRCRPSLAGAGNGGRWTAILWPLSSHAGSEPITHGRSPSRTSRSCGAGVVFLCGRRRFGGCCMKQPPERPRSSLWMWRTSTGPAGEPGSVPRVAVLTGWCGRRPPPASWAATSRTAPEVPCSLPGGGPALLRRFVTSTNRPAWLTYRTAAAEFRKHSGGWTLHYSSFTHLAEAGASGGGAAGQELVLGPENPVGLQASLGVGSGSVFARYGTSGGDVWDAAPLQ